MKRIHRYHRPDLHVCGDIGQLCLQKVRLNRIKLHSLICLTGLLLCLSCDDIFEKDIKNSVIDSLIPSTGWTTYNSIINFSWSSIEGATAYSFQLASPSFSGQHELVADSVLTNNKLTLTLNEGAYEWRVRGKNSVFFTNYSTGSLNILPAIDISQQKINLVEPLNAQSLFQSLVNFKWDLIGGAQYYLVRIKKGGWNDNNLVEQRVYKNTFSTTLEDGNYTWGVSGVDTIRHKTSDFSIGTFVVNKDAPVAAKLIAPVNKDTLKTNLIQFSWSKPENGLSYNLEVFSDANLSTLALTKQTTDTTAILDIKDNGQYFWRVKGTDFNNSTSSYSSVSTFCLQVKTVIDLTGKVVVLRSPSSNGYVTSTKVTFWWDEVPGADKYLIQVVSPDFIHTQNLIVNESLTAQSLSVELPAGAYQWRVKALNSIYTTAFFSDSFTIYQSNISSQLVSLTTPTDGSSLNSISTKFQWEPINGTNYQFVLKKGTWETGTEIQHKNVSIPSIEFTLTEGDYSWGVKAIDNINGSETNFSVRTFSVDRIPPLSPVLLSPDNNSTVATGQVSFQWKPSDQTDKDLSYTIDVYRQNGTMKELVVHQVLSATQYNFDYTDNGVYFWQVKATDKAGNGSEFCMLNTVNLSDNILTNKVVTLNAPFDGLESTNTEVTFWWNTVPGAESYEFQLVKPDFSQIEVLVKDTVIANNQITIQLQKGSYQWRVKAINSISESQYSTIYTIVIK